MIIRECTYSGKQYTSKQDCINAFDLITNNLGIEALHTHYNQGSVPEAWISMEKMSVSFKLQFISLNDQLDFISSIHLRNHKPCQERFLSAIQKELEEILK